MEGYEGKDNTTTRRRKKYEGRGTKRCGVARTDEERKWNERPG